MKSTKFDQRPNFEERLTVAIPADLKAKVFASATRRGLPASIVVRERRSKGIIELVGIGRNTGAKHILAPHLPDATGSGKPCLRRAFRPELVNILAKPMIKDGILQLQVGHELFRRNLAPKR